MHFELNFFQTHIAVLSVFFSFAALLWSWRPKASRCFSVYKDESILKNCQRKINVFSRNRESNSSRVPVWSLLWSQFTLLLFIAANANSNQGSQIAWRNSRVSLIKSHVHKRQSFHSIQGACPTITHHDGQWRKQNSINANIMSSIYEIMFEATRPSGVDAIGRFFHLRSFGEITEATCGLIE